MMPYSLWDEAQGKTPFNVNDQPRRCDLCGRRIEYGDYASVFVSEFICKTETSVVINEICFQHGGQHVDCLKAIEVDYGNSRSWPVIWASNLLDEAFFWFESVVRFARLVSTLSLRIVMHPVRYWRYKQIMHEWGVID